MTDGSGHISGPTRGAVILFIAAVLVAAGLVVAGTGYAVVSYQSSIQAGNQQWCTVLTLLTSKPVPKPSDPRANPSRLANYQLYEDFVKLRQEFGCSGG